MDVIGRAATLVPETRIEAMLFHLTTEGHIETGDESGRIRSFEIDRRSIELQIDRFL
jgi:hypothetical protein